MPLRKHCLLIALYCLGIQHLFAADPPAKRQYIPYFAFYSENRPFHERYLLNPIGFTSKELGRSFALVAGVSEYPKMSEARYKKLPQAAEDIRHLVAYLRDYEYFDEIVVLKDEAVNYENLNYFLDVYFPQQLRSSPKSRFLFAYSGHGMAEGKAPTGYLLKSSAQDFKDKENMIQMSVVRELLAPIIENGHQVLALINACHSGAFLRYSSAGGTLPRLAGAHAITAGGSTEKTWGDTQVGTGSMFFENLLIGLGGAADSSKDGIVTVDELYSFLKQKISAFTDEAQNPRLGDLRLQDNDGSFFFLNRQRQISRGNVKKWDASKVISFGDQTSAREFNAAGFSFYYPADWVPVTAEGETSAAVMPEEEVRRITSSLVATKKATIAADEFEAIFGKIVSSSTAEQIPLPPDNPKDRKPLQVDGYEATAVTYSSGSGGKLEVSLPGRKFVLMVSSKTPRPGLFETVVESLRFKHD